MISGPLICSSSFIGGVTKKKKKAKLRHLILLSRVTYWALVEMLLVPFFPHEVAPFSLKGIWLGSSFCFFLSKGIWLGLSFYFLFPKGNISFSPKHLGWRRSRDQLFSSISFMEKNNIWEKILNLIPLGWKGRF